MIFRALFLIKPNKEEEGGSVTLKKNTHSKKRL